MAATLRPPSSEILEEAFDATTFTRWGRAIGFFGQPTILMFSREQAKRACSDPFLGHPLCHRSLPSRFLRSVLFCLELSIRLHRQSLSAPKLPCSENLDLLRAWSSSLPSEVRAMWCEIARILLAQCSSTAMAYVDEHIAPRCLLRVFQCLNAHNAPISAETAPEQLPSNRFRTVCERCAWHTHHDAVTSNIHHLLACLLSAFIP